MIDTIDRPPLGLTRDNPYLSRVTTDHVPALSTDLQATKNLACAELIADFVRDSVAVNTKRAYRSDLDHFASWGGDIPASAETVAAYLAAHADTLSVATLVRRLASISKAHAAGAFPNPTRSELVRATMRGIKRTRSRAQHEARPLLRDDLRLVLDAMDVGLKAMRDRALLLIGFAGGLRRSELVALDVGDIEQVRQGIVLHLRRSKTDQEGRGQKIGIPHGRTRWCPVSALEAWMVASGIKEGAIFRPVDRHARLHECRLSGEAIALMIRERVAAAGLEPAQYSGHSLRAGLATSAAQAGVPTWRIKAQTRHASEAMLAKYIRDGELFTDNAAGALL
jgi:integrase